MTPEQLASCVDLNPGPRSESHLLANFQSHYFENTKTAIFEEAVRKSWKNMKVWALYGDEAPWQVIHSVFELNKMAKSELVKGVMFQTCSLKGANHFVSRIGPRVPHGIHHTYSQPFWDNPPQAILGFSYCIKN